MPTQIHTPLRPIPPPHTPTAKPIHLKMMDTILHHRSSQIKRLSSNLTYFDAFVSRLILTNVTGQYSEYLLTQKGGVEETACHYVALMYRTLDERLSRSERLHAVRCVREASGVLNNLLGKMERGESLDMDDGGREKKRRSNVFESREESLKKKSRIDLPQQLGSDDEMSPLKMRESMDIDQSESAKKLFDKEKNRPQADEINKTATDDAEELSFLPAASVSTKNHKANQSDRDAIAASAKPNSTARETSASAPIQKSTASAEPSQQTTTESTKTPAVSQDKSKASANQKTTASTSVAAPIQKSTAPADSTKQTTTASAKTTAVPRGKSTAIANQKTTASTHSKATEPSDRKASNARDKTNTPSNHKTALSTMSTQNQSTTTESDKDTASQKNPSLVIGMNSGKASTAEARQKANMSDKPPAADSANETMSKQQSRWGDKINVNTTTPSQSAASKHSETKANKSITTDVRQRKGSAVMDIETADNSSIHSSSSSKSKSKWFKPITKPKSPSKRSDDETASIPRKVDTTAASTKKLDAKTSSTAASTKELDKQKEQQHSVGKAATSNISSGATSAFKPINPSQRTVTDSTEESAAEAATTRTATDNTRASITKETCAVSTSTDAAASSSQSGKSNASKDSRPEKSSKSNEPASSAGYQDKNTAAADDDDIIDLITPPGSPIPTRKETPKPAQTKAPTPAIKQLPPSPPPVTKILNPPPTLFPEPRPFSQTRSVAFLADRTVPFASGSLHPRMANQFTYNAGYYLDGSGACLEHKSHLEVQERLSTWDPYWRIVGDIGLRQVKASSSGQTWVGTRTTACMPNAHTMVTNSSSVSSCAVILLNLPNSNKDLFVGVKWGQLATPDINNSRQRDQYKTGDTRLILRTLPLHRTAKDAKKRADTHLWPKGTFVQLGGGGGGSINDERIVPISQRRQEKHDEKSWKGMSHMLDLTRYANPHQAMSVKLCCAEVVESLDSASGLMGSVLSGSYSVHAAICQYISPDDLYETLMGKRGGGEVLIPTLSERSAKILAMEYVSNQTVALSDSEDEDPSNQPLDESNSLTFSLVCPIQKTPMETPVRGRNCRHLQCFDLKNFLRINEHVSGGRWRCGNCEDFLSVRDLIHCGLFQAMIDKYKGQISGVRDKVSLQLDGSFHLKDENKLRYANKKPAAASKAEEEVIIDLD